MAVLTTSDDTALALYDFGGGRGAGGTALFAHAAGLCATVLAPLARGLSRRFHCLAYDARGHGHSGRGPASSLGWSRFGDDAAEVAVALADDAGPLVGFGHSLGATAFLLAERERPGTFVRLCLYEPIVRISGDPHAHGEALVAATARRRDRFGSRDEAYARFSARPPFNAVAPAVLQAYVEDGLTDDGAGGVRLSCRPEDEAAIYRLGPLLVEGTLLDKVTCPVLVGYGGASRDPHRAAGVLLADALPSGASHELAELTHFGPLENPPAVASWIIHQY